MVQFLHMGKLAVVTQYDGVKGILDLYLTECFVFGLQKATKNHDYFITVSYLIYNEVIRSFEPIRCAFKNQRASGYGYIRRRPCGKASGPGDIEKFIEQSNKVRTVAETKMTLSLAP